MNNNLVPLSVPGRTSGRHQRFTYKLIERVLQAQVSTPIELLSAIVRDMVDNDRVVLTGGRVWQLDPALDAYTLLFQYGEVEFLDPNTSRTVQELPSMAQLLHTPTLVTTGLATGDKTERVFSLTGVGEPVERASGLLYPFALAFTSYEHNEEFYDTMLVIGSATKTALRQIAMDRSASRMKRDLDQAWEIQQGLVPDHRKKFFDYDIFGVSVPDAVVGGDYFDYLATSDDDRLGIVISDAASKGLAAAAQALFVSGAIRMGVSFETKIASLISRLNQLIYHTFPNERFVSLCYCELTSSASGLVLYANAGHCPPLHYVATTTTIEPLLPTGGILGVVHEQQFRIENINMKPGDVLLLFTDGITESFLQNGELYGEERLQEILRANAAKSAEEIAQILLDDVQAQTAGSRYSDDKTLVVIKRLSAA
jgi:phosphoserine phosphatase RsbU/P